MYLTFCTLLKSPEKRMLIEIKHLWELLLLFFARRCVCKNLHVVFSVQGDIATCAGTYLHVWDINGTEIAVVNTATSRNQQILCVAMSQVRGQEVTHT